MARGCLPPDVLKDVLEYMVEKNTKPRTIKLVFCENNGVDAGVLGKMSKRTRKAVERIIPRCPECTDYFKWGHAAMLLSELARHHGNDSRGNERARQRAAEAQRLALAVVSSLGENGRRAVEACPGGSQAALRRMGAC